MGAHLLESLFDHVELQEQRRLMGFHEAEEPSAYEKKAHAAKNATKAAFDKADATHLQGKERHKHFIAKHTAAIDAHRDAHVAGGYEDDGLHARQMKHHADVVRKYHHRLGGDVPDDEHFKKLGTAPANPKPKPKPKAEPKAKDRGLELDRGKKSLGHGKAGPAGWADLPHGHYGAHARGRDDHWSELEHLLESIRRRLSR